MFKIEIVKLGSDYAGTENETLETKSFESKKLANKEIRRMIKEEGFKKHAGHIFNNGVEIFTNF